MKVKKKSFVPLRAALAPRSNAANGAPRGLAAGGGVLFALVASDLPNDSLETALAITRVFQSELHVLRVLPDCVGINPLAPTVDELLRALDRRVQLEQVTRVWLEAKLGFELAERRLEVRYGDPVQEIADHARDLGAKVIVLAPGMSRFGEVVTALTRAAHLPVLVARGRAETEVIIAATDLQDRAFPVLRTAAEFSQRLKAQIVAVHNVGPSVARSGTSPGLTAHIIDARTRHLRIASTNLDIDADIVIARELSSADAILREARMRNVSLVVVGARPRSWLERLTSRGVAAQVVSGAQGSVLVTPLERGNRRSTTASR